MRSAISYVHYSGNDLNFITGCTPVSEGCAHCYARAIYERFGRDFSVVQTHPDKLKRLLTARFDMGGVRPRCFVCDTSDVFHPAVPADFIVQAFEVMAARKDVDWLVLTKRVDRMVDVLFGEEGNWYLGGGDYIPNVWMGVTAENRRWADERIPILLGAWSGRTWVSVEPMLGPVNLPAWNLSWVVCSAESGPHRRPFDPAWAKALYEQCKAAGIPFYSKQGSGLRPGVPLLIDGKEVKEFPA